MVTFHERDPFVAHGPFVARVPEPVWPWQGNWAYLGKNMMEGRVWPAAAVDDQAPSAFDFFVTGGTSKVIGGSTGGQDLFLDTVGTMGLAGWKAMPSMLESRAGHAAVFVDGKLYVLGGFRIPTGPPPLSLDVLSTVEVYDPSTGQWTQRAFMPTARHGLAAAAWDSKIYAIGGFGDPGGFAVLEVYDTQTDTWDITHPPMPNDRSGLAAAVIGDVLYVVGGMGGNEMKAQTLAAYDLSQRKWEPRNPMPTGRSHLAAAVMDGKLYAMGGEGVAQFYPADQSWPYSRPLADVEVYDPIRDKWYVAPRMLTPRKGLAAVTLTQEIRYFTSAMPAVFPPNLPHEAQGVPFRSVGRDERHPLAFGGSPYVHTRKLQQIYAIGGATTLPGQEEYLASVEVYPAPLPNLIVAPKSAKRSGAAQENSRTAKRRRA